MCIHKTTYVQMPVLCDNFQIIPLQVDWQLEFSIHDWVFVLFILHYLGEYDSALSVLTKIANETQGKKGLCL